MMKKKLLFANTYFYPLDKKQWKAQTPYPPYGTILAAAILRQAGFNVDLFDACLAQSPVEIISSLLRTKPDYLVIFDDNFNYLSKMCLTVMREACFTMIQLGKAEGCKVIINSADATDHYADYLKAGADVVLLGEAEETLHNVLKNNLEHLENFSGVAYIKAETIIHTPKKIVTQH